MIKKNAKILIEFNFTDVNSSRCFVDQVNTFSSHLVVKVIALGIHLAIGSHLSY